MTTTPLLAAITTAAITSAALGIAPATPAHANPGTYSAEQNYYQTVYTHARPAVSWPRLLDLGYLTCGLRTNGATTNHAKEYVWIALRNQGVTSSNAEIGSLVHTAIKTLCPEVGYP